MFGKKSQKTPKRHTAAPVLEKPLAAKKSTKGLAAKAPASKRSGFFGDAAVRAEAETVEAMTVDAVVPEIAKTETIEIKTIEPVAAEVMQAETVKTEAVEVAVPEEAKAETVEIAAVEPADPVVTSEAIAAAAAQVDPAVVAKLIEDLRGDDADAAREAAGSLGDASAVEPLIEVVVNADGYYHSVVRAAAAASLGRLKDPRAVEPLIGAVRDSMAEASAEAIGALAELGDARAVTTLIDVIRNRSGYYLSFVRRAAVLALGQLGGERAIGELRAVAEDTWEDSLIRQDAQDALASIV